jgi:[CysO sulfur-carrier protein]-S-L-cysteine hydrolase
MNVTADARLIDAMTDHAKKLYPQEACGILAGHGRNATRFIPLPNALSSETAYEIDPGVLAGTLRGLRANAEELVAIFHSHPRGPAEPSPRDLEQAFYPEAAHIIVSLASREEPQIRAFRIIDGRSLEIELHAIV